MAAPDYFSYALDSSITGNSALNDWFSQVGSDAGYNNIRQKISLAEGIAHDNQISKNYFNFMSNAALNGAGSQATRDVVQSEVNFINSWVSAKKSGKTSLDAFKSAYAASNEMAFRAHNETDAEAARRLQDQRDNQDLWATVVKPFLIFAAATGAAVLTAGAATGAIAAADAAAVATTASTAINVANRAGSGDLVGAAGAAAGMAGVDTSGISSAVSDIKDAVAPVVTAGNAVPSVFSTPATSSAPQIMKEPQVIQAQTDTSREVYEILSDVEKLKQILVGALIIGGAGFALYKLKGKML